MLQLDLHSFWAIVTRARAARHRTMLEDFTNMRFAVNADKKQAEEWHRDLSELAGDASPQESEKQAAIDGTAQFLKDFGVGF